MGDAVSPYPRLRLALAGVLALSIALPSAAGAAQNPADSAGSGGTAVAPRVLVGAGDISSCSNSRDSNTAALVQKILQDDTTATAFTAGDNVYPHGSAANYANCYGPTWGVFKARTRPVPGNHDFLKNTRAYYNYFGIRAGKFGRGYYRTEFASWRILWLTSECGPTTTCFTNQLNFVRADLVDNPHLCTLAVWHRARFSSGGEHGGSPRMAQIVQLLYDHGADLVVSGHDHHYERFQPVDPSGTPAANGIRYFISGLGGASRYPLAATPHPASEVRYNADDGVLKLTLGPGTYSWEFLTVDDESFTDTGTGACH
jgi:hypothetical protein